MSELRKAHTENPSISELLKQAASELKGCGIASPRLEAEMLLGYCLGKSRTYLYLSERQPVSEKEQQLFHKLLERRKTQEPLAYIVGEREFWSLDFYVSPAVLIPRPETEFLLETVLKHYEPVDSEANCLDLCCGSGVIAVVLAKELKSQVYGVDISEHALEVARKNCIRHDVQDNVVLMQADMMGAFKSESFSLIVSNPPYVKKSDIKHSLDPEVREYEPHLALDGGKDGLDCITEIRDSLAEILVSGGQCFIEIGADQGEQVKNLFLHHKHRGMYDPVKIYRDYAGRDRVAHIRKSGT